MPLKTSLLDIVIHERPMKKIKPVIENYLIEFHNEPKIADIILGFLKGECDRCHYQVSNTFTVNKYKKKNVCISCYNKFYKKKLNITKKINDAKNCTG